VRKHAKASSAGATRFAGAAQIGTAGSSSTILSSAGARDGSGAPSARRFGLALAAAAALAVAFLCLAAGSASASYIHPEPSYEFGTDGTPATTIGQIDSMTYNQATDQVLVLSKESPRHIYAFHFNGFGSYSPSPAPFPLEVPGGGGDPQIDVDNSGTATAGNIFYSQDGEELFGFAPSGSELGSFSPEPNEKCGAAVDKTGHPWSGNYSGEQVEEFEWSGGGPIKIVDTSGQGSPCHLIFDRSTNDLYVSMWSSGLWRYTASSGYSPASAEQIDPRGNTKIAINAVKHVLYAAQGDTVKAYDTASGSQLEEFSTSWEIRGIAVDDNTDTVFTSNTNTSKVQEWKGVVVPDVTTGPSEGNATVTGSVGTAGAGEVTECKFEWKEQGAPSFEDEIDCTPAAPYTTDQPEVSAELPGLEGEHTYVYRLVATNANGTAYGGTNTITPHNVTGIRTKPATEIERESATFNASFEGNGEDTTYYFEYGIDSVEEHTTAVEDAGSPTGAVNVSTDVSGLVAGRSYQYRVVGTNGLGSSTANIETFETDAPIKEIETLPATDVEPSTATLHGSLNPDGYETEYFFEYGKTTAYGQRAPLTPAEVGTTAPGTANLSTSVANLESGTAYHFRLVATNSTGTSYGGDEVFETPQAPSIISFASDNVTATTAELKARINPNGYDTEYFFEYGTTTDYGSKIPVPNGTIPASNNVEDVVVELTGLQGTTYHFRLSATNRWGTTTTEDQSFTFNPPRGCPNTTVRQETGAAYLPDCRAYELVSPGRAGGSAIFYDAPWSPYASNPGRFAFVGAINAIPGSGEPLNGGFGDLYVASRTNTGWVTKYVGLPGWHSIAMGPERWSGLGIGAVPTDRAMNHFVIWDWGNVGFTTGGDLWGNSTPYVYDNEGHELGRLPTNWEEIPNSTLDTNHGGWEGDAKLSGDYTHYVFSSRELPFAPGGLDEAPGSVYDNDIAAGTVVVISKTPAGDDIPQDPLGTRAPFPSKRGTNGEEFIEIPALSSDGSHVLMSTAGPGGRFHLYMTVDDTQHYEVSKGEDGKNHAVTFAGMTDDGSTVYFTSPERMNSEDTDSNVDIYKWSEATDSLTLVSKGSEGTGNGSSCGAGWIGGCSVEVVPRPYHNAGGSTEPPLDTVMASEAGDLYFYSPEQLDGSRGALGLRNLYVYRGGGVHFVAALQPSSPSMRMNVAPDGSHMALVTRSQLTSYNAGGHAEMYTYDAAARAIKCVSCLPSGNPPSGDVEASQNGLFMTEDGRAFFSTDDSLVAQDANGIEDVYEFVEGRPQLISTGTGDTAGNSFRPAGLVGVSEDGTDAFFGTYNTMVPEDENGGFLKFYDARTNGGFPFNKPPAPCAAADECHGPETAQPANPIISTGANLSGRGNFHKARHKRHHKRHRKHHHQRHHCKQHGKCHHGKPGSKKGTRGGRHG